MTRDDHSIMETWRLSVEQLPTGAYLATVLGHGRGVRVRASSPEEAVEDLATALGQDDEVGRAIRAYVISGEDLARRVASASRVTATQADAQPGRSDHVKTTASDLRASANTANPTPAKRSRATRQPARKATSVAVAPHAYGRRYFTFVNPLTAAGLYVLADLAGAPQVGAWLAVGVLGAFVAGLIYVAGAASR